MLDLRGDGRCGCCASWWAGPWRSAPTEEVLASEGGSGRPFPSHTFFCSSTKRKQTLLSVRPKFCTPKISSRKRCTRLTFQKEGLGQRQGRVSCQRSSQPGARRETQETAPRPRRPWHVPRPSSRPGPLKPLRGAICRSRRARQASVASSPAHLRPIILFLVKRTLFLLNDLSRRSFEFCSSNVGASPQDHMRSMWIPPAPRSTLLTPGQ